MDGIACPIFFALPIHGLFTEQFVLMPPGWLSLLPGVLPGVHETDEPVHDSRGTHLQGISDAGRSVAGLSLGDRPRNPAGRPCGRLAGGARVVGRLDDLP